MIAGTKHLTYRLEQLLKTDVQRKVAIREAIQRLDQAVTAHPFDQTAVVNLIREWNKALVLMQELADIAGSKEGLEDLL